MISASIVALAASSAYAGSANIIDVGGSPNNVVTLYDVDHLNPSTNPFEIDGSGATFDSFVNITPNTVTFESSNASSGFSASTTSSSIVTLSIKNTSDHTVTPTLDSTITPAGFGFYVTDPSGGCGGNIYSGCAPVAVPLSSFAPSGDGLNILAGASFSFKIFDGDSTDPIYNATGSILLTSDNYNDGTKLLYSFNETAGGLTLNPEIGALSGMFGAGESTEFGYNWNARDIDLVLADLGVGGVRTIRYETSATSFTSLGCINENACLVSYSGFGDPIGRGGGVDSLRVAGGVSAFDVGGGLDFQPVVYEHPTYDADTGHISFNLIPPVSTAPEPATWAMLLLGFGGLGGVLRRQRNPRYI